ASATGYPRVEIPWVSGGGDDRGNDTAAAAEPALAHAVCDVLAVRPHRRPVHSDHAPEGAGDGRAIRRSRRTTPAHAARHHRHTGGAGRVQSRVAQTP